MTEKSQQEQLQAIIDWVKSYVAMTHLQARNHIKPVPPEANDQYEIVANALKETFGYPDLEV